MRFDLFVGVVVFLVVVAVIEGGYLVARTLRAGETQRVRRRLEMIRAGSPDRQEVDIVRRRLLSHIPWLNRLLAHSGRLSRLDRLIQQSGIGYPLGVFVLLSLVLGLGGYLAGALLMRGRVVQIPAALVLAWLPFGYLRLKSGQRMDKFRRQLPDALDLIARALKAGHAFTSGFKIAAEEFDDPVGTEFERTLAEINFGVAVPTAMKNLSTRVDCTDLRFFVIAVVIQRETGGNLAEIIENIAKIIRDRFLLQGRIRILSAEARFSAFVLVVLPFVAAFSLMIIQPAHVSLLVTDPIGNALLGAGSLLMIAGIAIMRRMVNFKV